MAITEYIEGGVTFYDVYVNYRSKINPKIRTQKRIRWIETKAHAEKIEHQLWIECVENAKKEENRGFYWGDLCVLWKAYELKNDSDPLGPDTIDDYFNALKNWTKEFWEIPASEITKGHIRNVIRSAQEQDKSKSFQAKIKFIIQKVFVWGQEESYIKGVHLPPTTGIKINRKTEKIPEILNIDDMKKLLESGRTIEHPWYPIWATAMLTGMRNGELFALEWDDVDFEGKNIVVSKSFNNRKNITKSTKAGYWRNVPINSDLEIILLQLKAQATTKFVLPRCSDWTKGNQAKVLRTFCQTIGLPSVKFHTLRACFATQLIRNGVAPASVMKVCGWKDLDTMARYIRLAGIDERGATNSLQILSPASTMEFAGQMFR